MLRSLRVRNLALAENLSVEFGSGLNIITGETGAGKSILLGALALILGERADKGLIRTGEEQCSAEAVFDLQDSKEIPGALVELGLPACEAGQLILRRTIKSTGGQCWVNDAPVTVQVLRSIGGNLVDMHGPHDHQSLLSQDAQRDLLDAFAHSEKAIAKYREAYGAWREALDRKAALEAAGPDAALQIDLLAHRVKEIEEAALVEGEEEAVRQEHSVVGNAHRILELGAGVSNALNGDEGSAFQALVSVRHALEELARLLPSAAEWKREIGDLAVRLQALGQTVQSDLARLEADPARLDWLDHRLSTYQRILRKHGPTLEDVFQALALAKERLTDLRTREQQLSEIGGRITVARAEVDRSGGKLTLIRRSASEELAEAIGGELEFLGFPGSSFSIGLAEAEPGPSGLDQVEFGFAPNVGESMRSLRTIASSGEISRVMLAVKAVLAEQDRVPVLVFDEIDANLGGGLGHAVGRELAGVATRHQVLCITHLPQVAVHGTHHFAVRKEAVEGRTRSRVESLQREEDRVGEIARMLGGPDSSAALAHARDLIRRAKTAR